MSRQQIRRVLAAAVLGTALVSLPAGAAGATEVTRTPETSACTWQKTAWELPENATIAQPLSYDGSRYAVGVTGTKPAWGHGIASPRSTLWDDGKVVMRADESIPHFRDVNAAGLVVGDTVVNKRFIGITVAHDGQTTRLPANPAWTSYSAWKVNNAGDIAGWASIAEQDFLVVWPGNAPGTYRETPVPGLSTTRLVEIDEQGRVIVQGDSTGYVVDPAGQWHALAAEDTLGKTVPLDIRDGRIVGEISHSNRSYSAEWDARGSLVRTIRDLAGTTSSIGGHGTVASSGGNGVKLLRDGVVVEHPITTELWLAGLSDDERTIVGVENVREIPVHYRCS